MNTKILVILATASLGVCAANAQFSIAPLASFSGGWLYTNEYSGLTGGNNERSLAYGGGYVYLASGTTLRALNPLTGAEVASLNMTGVSGGARALNTIGVGADGVIYGANLTTDATASAFKIYRWDNNTAAPVVAYSGAPLATARIGDSLDVFGSGANTRIVAGYGNTALTTDNTFAVIDPTAGTATHITFPGEPPAQGDFRLGITFGPNATTVFGDQGGTATDTRLVTYSGGTGSFVASLTLNAASERQMDYTVIGGLPLLATIEAGGAATSSTVRIYDVTDLQNPVLLGSARNAEVAVGNSNGSGGVAWGEVFSNVDGTYTANLYAMDTNEGLQAFQVVGVPEPGTGMLLLLGLGMLIFGQRIRR